LLDAQRSEAEIIRDSIRIAVGGEWPQPRGLFASNELIAREADEHLDGFGDR
jgi:hypothetical protein